MAEVTHLSTYFLPIKQKKKITNKKCMEFHFRAYKYTLDKEIPQRNLSASHDAMILLRNKHVSPPLPLFPPSPRYCAIQPSYLDAPLGACDYACHQF